MTCIAWDGRTLAADRRGCRGDTVCTIRKIERIGDRLVGTAGHSGICQVWLDWYQRGAVLADYPDKISDDDMAAIVVETGHVWLYTAQRLPVEILDPYCAIGSGREAALGALHMGATAEQAVEAAIRWISSCGNGIDTLTLAD